METGKSDALTEPDERFGPGKTNPIQHYLNRLRAFSTNARLLLLSTFIFGLAGGINQLLFNFYVLSQGYTEAALGNLVTARSFTTLLAALPMGYLVDRMGRKNAFIASNIAYAVSIAAMILFPSVPMFLAMSVVQGLSQALSVVAMGPFMMENSQEAERTYLFSFSSGIRMTATSAGEWLGGYLPGFFAGMLLVSKMSTAAYSGSLWLVAVFALASVIPVFFIKEPKKNELSTQSVFAPVTYMRKEPKKLTKLIVPNLITSIGAGMIMPFMNVFFRNAHGQSDSAIGVIFAWGSLAMGFGLIIAPMLAERFGKIQVVVLSQALSIPFLALLGFAPGLEIAIIAYYFRLTLMNMSSPIFSTFAMEQVEPEARAMLASLNSMAFNFGWAFSPTISGFLQVRYGFGPSFGITMVLYTISTLMYFVWFWKDNKKPAEIDETTTGDCS